MTGTKEAPSAEQSHDAPYDVAALRRRYGISRQEAERLLFRFGSAKSEIDLLLSARDRRPKQRKTEIDTSGERAAFGIG